MDGVWVRCRMPPCSLCFAFWLHHRLQPDAQTVARAQPAGHHRSIVRRRKVDNNAACPRPPSSALFVRERDPRSMRLARAAADCPGDAGARHDAMTPWLIFFLVWILMVSGCTRGQARGASSIDLSVSLSVRP